MIWLDNSRIVAIFGVVFLHTANVIIDGSSIGSEYWWIRNFCDTFGRWCVPVFVMVSGALLLDPNKKEDLETFYKKRISRILAPIVFWSLFFLLWGMLKGMIKGSPLSLADLLELLISGTPYYHMWFLYMIIMLYLFTPFFRKIIANSSRRDIAIVTVLTFLMGALNTVYFHARPFSHGSTLFINRFLSFIPFFFLGYLVRTGERDVSKTILWSVFLLSSFLTVLGYYIEAANKGLDAGLYFHSYLSITIIFMSMSIVYLLKSWTSPIISEKFTSSLSLLTFGVYLIHPIILDTIQYFGFGLLDLHPAVSIPVIAIIAFGFSLIASWVIYRVPYLKRVV